MRLAAIAATGVVREGLLMFRIAVAVALCIVFGAVACHAQPAAQAEIKANIPYGPDPAQRLDLCLPAAGQPGPRPAVVLIHGGYWTMGDKGMYAELCRGAASEGIVAAAIGYRLANGDPHNRWPAPLVDAQLAVRWLRSRAAEFAVDPARICALGDSAGAHLAVFLAVLDHTVPGDYSDELASASSRVACAVDNFGPVDLSADSYWPPDQQLFGNQDRTQVKEQERAASPLFLAGAHTAPIIIAHGRDDKAVNIAQSMQLADQLKSQHVPVRMIVLNAGHEFAGLSAQEMGTVFQQELDFIKSARPR
jgi:acetyl esterase/lipase